MNFSKIGAVVTYIVAMAFTALVISLRPDLLDAPNTFVNGLIYSNLILAMCVGIGILGRQ